MKFGVGQPGTSVRGQAVADRQGALPGRPDPAAPALAIFVRSPHAHARIVSIDTTAASRAPGVAAVYTGQDYADDGISTPKGRHATQEA